MTRRRDPVGAAVQGLLALRGGARRTLPDAPAGSADVAVRLATLEREVREVRTRIHALFFAVLTAGLGDLVGRLVLG
ncbi:MAG: hypothetical protein M0R73_12795 [Dehalococcoidia bacterium]|nr:hypothetical protein [Dehalococcoidia bacterium]